MTVRVNGRVFENDIVVWNMANNLFKGIFHNNKLLYCSLTYENDWHFPSFDTVTATVVLWEKCFLPFNSRLSVPPFYAFTFVYTRPFSEFAGIWMVNIFRPQTGYDRDFILLAIFTDAHKHQVSFSCRRQTVATSLRLQRIFNNTKHN